MEAGKKRSVVAVGTEGGRGGRKEKRETKKTSVHVQSKVACGEGEGRKRGRRE